jgi:hypothetical protein
MNFIAALIELLVMILKAEEKRSRESEAQEHQDKIDEMHEDPAKALDEHFNGKKEEDDQ